MTRKEIQRYSFTKSIPIMCSYLFVGMAYGILMEEAGFHWYYSLLVSLTVYTGAFQFVLTSLLAGGATFFSIAITAFFMNSRQVFYSLSFTDDFSKMGKLKPYMIHTMTDETYAVNCTLDLNFEDKKKVMLYVAFFSRCYWMTGAVFGGVAGYLIPFSMEGIDFCMTALFVIIFIDQWEKSDTHFPALSGLLVAVLSLFIFGENKFILPALLIVSVGLVIFNDFGSSKRRETGNNE